MRRVLPILLLLAACTQPSPAPPVLPASIPAAGPDAYRAAAAAGGVVYRVDPDASLITVIVRRAGLMARLGHDHVVASGSVMGFAAPGLNRADISFRLDQMSVDEPQLLRDADLATRPSPEAIEGTRKNMLGPVLDAEHYPVVSLHAEIRQPGQLDVAITLHGVTRWLAMPAAVQAEPRQLSAHGQTRLKQTDFGIRPLSLGGGLLAVQDELELRYRIVARRWTPPGP